MDDFDLGIARAELLEVLGRFTEAAELHLEEGNLQKAIQLFIRASTNTSARRAYECLLDSFWKFFSIGASFNLQDENLQILLQLSARLDVVGAHVEDALRDEVSQWQTAVQDTNGNLRSLCFVQSPLVTLRRSRNLH